MAARNEKRSSRYGFAAIGVLSLGICGAPPVAPARAQDSGPTLAAIATYGGPDRAARILAGAKKEGSLNVYTSETVDDVAALGAAFQSKYGIKLNVWRGSANDILQRAVIEARGDRFDVDAFETGATAMESLQREQLLQQVASPAFADLKPEAIRPHREWIGTRYNVFVAAYNTGLVAKADLPKSYNDLTDPKWKGKLGIEAESSDWFGALIQALGEQRGLKLFRAIVAANGISVRRGHTLLANLVVSGEVPLAISTYLYKAAQLKARGAPIDWIGIPPVVARFEGVGVARHAPHPYAAMLYLDFMLTDAQAILAKRDFLPASSKVASMPDDALPPGTALTFLDSALALDQNQKWSKYYREIVTHQPR
jgi:iron(III) transport system substrate-binding protein